MIRSRTLHKWIGIAVGSILLMWSVTGIILMIPGRRVETRFPALDARRVTMNPAEAIAALGDSVGAVRSLSLVQLHDLTVYRIDTGRRPILIDAATGRRVEVTAALAESIVRGALGRSSGAVRVQLIRRHDGAYSSGTLPVWRVAFADGELDPAHVTQSDGTLWPPGSRTRFRSLSHDLHNFAILRNLVEGSWFYRSLAIMAGAVSVISIVTGYWLALPRRRRPARTTAPMTVQ